LEKVFYEDIPLSIGIKTSNISLLKRILWLIATSQPFKPNIEKISREMKISKEFVYTYIDALERACLLTSILPAESGYRLIRKPSKIYIENPNLLKALAGATGGEAIQGTIRETFFAQQLSAAGLNLLAPPTGDFLVDKKFLFEVGEKNKGKSQLKGEKNSFLVKDDIETGHLNSIPLWLFGFLY
jgi:uncharacterized protein